MQRTTGVNLWLFYEAHIGSYFSGLQNGRDVLSMNAHFASLGSGSVMWTMLCEGEGWGKGKVPWDRTYTMVTHLTDSFCPGS